MLPKKLTTEKEVLANSLEEALDFLEMEFKIGYFDTSLKDIEIFEDGTVTAEGKSWPYTPRFMESLAKKIHMPINYAYRMDFDLFKKIFDICKKLECTAVKLCISHGIAINVCKTIYSPARSVDIINNLPEKMKDWKLHEVRLGDMGVEISWCNDMITVEPRQGDTILGGVRLSNSETGFRGLKASVFTLRLACLNGAIFSDEQQVVRWSHDRRMTYSKNIDNFCKELNLLEIPQAELTRIYSNVLERHISDKEIVNLWRRIRRVVEPQIVDLMLGIGSRERQELFDHVREREDPFVSEATRLNTYEIHNRITAAAKDHSLIKRRRLEEIGGNLICSLPLN